MPLVGPAKENTLWMMGRTESGSKACMMTKRLRRATSADTVGGSELVSELEQYRLEIFGLHTACALELSSLKHAGLSSTLKWQGEAKGIGWSACLPLAQPSDCCFGLQAGW